MRQKSVPPVTSSEQVVKDIRRATRKQYSAEEKIRIVLVGEKIESVFDRAPCNNTPIGGIKVSSASSCFAARPLCTEDIYRIYAESFKVNAHLQLLLQEVQGIMTTALAAQ